MNRLVIDRLTHRYRDGRLALQELSLVVAAGERVALLGPNGAGKTTLFLRLAGVLPGVPGAISVAGLDPARPEDRAQLPQRLGIVFQQADEQLFAGTVLEDVAFAPLNQGRPAALARAEAQSALARVGLTGWESRLPWELSGGEKRRVALAGVLVQNPEFLILDEPTAGLDPRGRRELAVLLKELPGAMIIATHNLEFAQAVCPRGVILDAGQLVADGPLPDLLADPERLLRHGLR